LSKEDNAQIVNKQPKSETERGERLSQTNKLVALFIFDSFQKEISAKYLRRKNRNENKQQFPDDITLSIQTIIPLLHAFFSPYYSFLEITGSS
jgi:hypothetical protein